MPSFSLGVLDPALTTAIAENLHISCRSDDTIREILRGCRLHLEYFVKGLQATTTTTTGYQYPHQGRIGIGTFLFKE